MNCRELFVGGYYDNDGDIIKMDSSKLSYILEVGGEYEYNPIPLTEDWLLKFGFEKSEVENPFYGYEFFLKGLSVYLKNGTIRFYHQHSNRTWVEYESVHELQNLYFALTGEELSLSE